MSRSRFSVLVLGALTAVGCSDDPQQQVQVEGTALTNTTPRKVEPRKGRWWRSNTTAGSTQQPLAAPTTSPPRRPSRTTRWAEPPRQRTPLIGPTHNPRRTVRDLHDLRDLDGPADPPRQPPAAVPLRVGPVRTLTRGKQLMLGKQRLGLGDIYAPTSQQAIARLSVGVGAHYYLVDASAGQRIAVGGGLLEVVSVRPQTVRYRWIEKPNAAASQELIRPVDPRGGALRLTEMGLYRLPDGTVVGVGNVRAEFESARINLCVFPRDYAQQPLEGYDYHPDVQASAQLEGWVRSCEVRRVVPGTTRAGWVEVVLRTVG